MSDSPFDRFENNSDQRHGIKPGTEEFNRLYEALQDKELSEDEQELQRLTKLDLVSLRGAILAKNKEETEAFLRYVTGLLYIEGLQDDYSDWELSKVHLEKGYAPDDMESAHTHLRQKVAATIRLKGKLRLSPDFEIGIFLYQLSQMLRDHLTQDFDFKVPDSEADRGIDQDIILREFILPKSTPEIDFTGYSLEQIEKMEVRLRVLNHLYLNHQSLFKFVSDDTLVSDPELIERLKTVYDKVSVEAIKRRTEKLFNELAPMIKSSIEQKVTKVLHSESHPLSIRELTKPEQEALLKYCTLIEDLGKQVTRYAAISTKVKIGGILYRHNFTGSVDSFLDVINSVASLLRYELGIDSLS